jgi:hypothetical protein
MPRLTPSSYLYGYVRFKRGPLHAASWAIAAWTLNSLHPLCAARETRRSFNAK